MARSTTTSKTPSTRSKTAASKTTPKTAAAKAATSVSTSTTAATPSLAAAPAAITPELKVVGDVTAKLTTGEMKKRELIKAVVARSGTRQKFAKPVVEAMLAILGETLVEGRELTLPPMGKVKIQRQKTVSGGTVTVMKLRRTANMVAQTTTPSEDETGAEKAADDDNEALADPEE
ncbi:MAG: HU family DNA-binding protein [Paracoccaceae bacterium]